MNTAPLIVAARARLTRIGDALTGTIDAAAYAAAHPRATLPTRLTFLIDLGPHDRDAINWETLIYQEGSVHECGDGVTRVGRAVVSHVARRRTNTTTGRTHVWLRVWFAPSPHGRACGWARRWADPLGGIPVSVSVIVAYVDDMPVVKSVKFVHCAPRVPGPALTLPPRPGPLVA